jgi:8-oxo-dGTP pyrophosphatase MutT (NUDIX family)
VVERGADIGIDGAVARRVDVADATGQRQRRAGGKQETPWHHGLSPFRVLVADAEAPMSLLRHIRRCNDFAPQRFVPLLHEGARLGRVRRDNAARLAWFPSVFRGSDDKVELVAKGDVEAVSQAVDDAFERLVEEGGVLKWRHERFAVAPRWGAPPVLLIDRGLMGFLGAKAYGVHLNGWRRDGGRMLLWIGRRAANKKVAPGKLDNLVAGGIGAGHGIADTLVKEAQEEAAIPPALIATATPTGAISYCMETPEGLRDDVLFTYDLEVPADFVPRNTDGEIVSFKLMDAADVLSLIRRADDFKFNVALVIIDFAIRHGLVTPDDPKYLDLVTGLHRPLY